MIDSYEKLPIGKYLEIIALPSDLPEMEYNVRVVGILAGLDDDAVLDMPLPDFQAHVAAAHFLTAPVLDKDGRHPHNGKNVADTYTLGGMKLRLAMDVTKMNVAQYVDFQTFAKGDSVQNFPQLLSCVLIPDGKTYNEGYDVLVVQDAIRRNMPTTDAFALSAFFLRRWLRYIHNTLIYSLRDLKKKPNKTAKDLELIKKTKATIVSLHGGAGLQTWIRLLKQPAKAGRTYGI